MRNDTTRAIAPTARMIVRFASPPEANLYSLRRSEGASSAGSTTSAALWAPFEKSRWKADAVGSDWPWYFEPRSGAPYGRSTSLDILKKLIWPIFIPQYRASGRVASFQGGC